MQKERSVAALLFHSMSGNEMVSDLFEFNLEVLSEDEELSLEDLLG